MSCGYTGRHFGASYEDAQCHEGYLWDLDSYDGEGLTSGGDIPCPQCNTKSWIHDIVDDYANGIHGSANYTLNDQAWHRLLNAFMSLTDFHSFNTLGLLLSEESPKVPYWQPGDDFEDFPKTEICWPFPLDHITISAHNKLQLIQQATPPDDCIKDDNKAWIRPLLD